MPRIAGDVLVKTFRVFRTRYPSLEHGYTAGWEVVRHPDDRIRPARLNVDSSDLLGATRQASQDLVIDRGLLRLPALVDLETPRAQQLGFCTR